MWACCSDSPCEWLSGAARRLAAADPVRALGPALATHLPTSFADGHDNALVPGAAPLELSFSEREPGALRLDFESAVPGAVEAAAQRAAEAFGGDAAFALQAGGDGRCFVGVGVGPRGLCELTLYRPLDAAAAPGARAAAAALAGLQPLMQAVAVEPAGTARRDYLVARAAVELDDLDTVACALGLAARAPELRLTLARLLGEARWLPPDSLVVGLRPAPGGVELKLDVMLEGLWLEDPLRRVAELLAERPDSRAAYARWLAAVTPPSAELVATVVSLRVAPAHATRLNVYVHPRTIAWKESRSGHTHAAAVR